MAVMAVAKRFRQTPIRLTKHAVIRFEERVTFPWEKIGVEMPAYIERGLRSRQRRRLVNHIRNRLFAAMKLGVRMKDGKIHVGLEGGYKAVLVLDRVGWPVGWTVLTILEPPGSIINEKSKGGKAV